MRRALMSVLAAALLLTAASDHAQQSPPGSSSTAPGPAKPQNPAQQQPAPPQDQSPARQDEGRITTVVNLVDVLFTVLDRRNKLVPGLEKENFKIWDDKSPQSIR